MAGRPKKEDSREKQYRVRLNEEEDAMLEYASSTTGKQKSEIFRQALREYYQKVRLNIASNSYAPDFWEVGLTLKRVVDCPYCGMPNAIDFDDYCTETVDDDGLAGDEAIYNFDIPDYQCQECKESFGIVGFISEYPPGVLDDEEIHIYPNASKTDTNTTVKQEKKMARVDGETCEFAKGPVVYEWLTGDDECNAYSKEYQCGGVYNHNYMDIVGCRDHDCFWNCSKCKYQESK